MVKIKVFPEQKKSWIKVFESVIAILLITTVTLMIIARQDQETNPTTVISNEELAVLREIQINDELRQDIPGGSEPIDWDDADFPVIIKDKIGEMPEYLDCMAKICSFSDDCLAEDLPNKDIYSRAVFISSSLNEEIYRQLKIFCWVK